MPPPRFAEAFSPWGGQLAALTPCARVFGTDRSTTVAAERSPVARLIGNHRITKVPAFHDCIGRCSTRALPPFRIDAFGEVQER